MTSVKLEGDIEDISLSQLEFVATILEKEGFRDTTGLIKNIGDGGNGYMSIVKRIEVKKYGKTFTAILKLAFTSEKMRNTINTGAAFHNEHVFYTGIFPKLTDFENAAGMPKDHRMRNAKCYGSNDEKGHEVLVLEDLSDFVMLDKNKPLSNDTVKLFLKDLAKLHAFSFVLKNKEPEKFKDFKESIINIYELKSYAQVMSLIAAMLEEDMLTLFDKDKYKDAFRGTVSQMPSLMNEVVLEDEGKYFVFTHGDAWTNNVMFRLEGNKVIESCMIDFQISTFRSPVSDVYFMIFNCTDYESRRKHFNEWIHYYYAELEYLISKYNLNINYIYPKERFNSDLKKYAKVSLSYSAVMYFFFVKESQEAAKMKANLKEETDMMQKIAENSKITSQDETTRNKYKERMEGIVDSLIEMGLFLN